MNKRIIFHIVGGIVGALIYYFFFDETTLGQVFIFFIAYVILSYLVDIFLERRRNKQRHSVDTSVDDEKVTAFIEAIGGIKNIISTDYESSRLKVVINEVDLLDQEKLKDLDLNGAYLSGNQLQVTIGSNASDFSRQIAELIP